jgi:hypothetical protein
VVSKTQLLLPSILLLWVATLGSRIVTSCNHLQQLPPSEPHHRLLPTQWKSSPFPKTLCTAIGPLSDSTAPTTWCSTPQLQWLWRNVFHKPSTTKSWSPSRSRLGILLGESVPPLQLAQYPAPSCITQSKELQIMSKDLYPGPTKISNRKSMTLRAGHSFLLTLNITEEYSHTFIMALS